MPSARATPDAPPRPQGRPVLLAVCLLSLISLLLAIMLRGRLHFGPVPWLPLLSCRVVKVQLFDDHGQPLPDALAPAGVSNPANLARVSEMLHSLEYWYSEVLPDQRPDLPIPREGAALFDLVVGDTKYQLYFNHGWCVLKARGQTPARQFLTKRTSFEFAMDILK